MRLFFTRTITVARLTNSTGSTIKENYGSSTTTILGAIMNAKPEDSMLSEGNPSKSSVLFCDVSADVIDTDKITCDGVSYIVKGINTIAGIGMGLSYKKAVIEKLNS